nr:restriction endonuclease subunit S [Acinetobacter sp. YH12205]
MAVPKLRFKEFDADYTNTTFEKLKGFSIQSGKSEEKGDTGEFPFYGSTGVIGYKDIFDYEGKSILIARVGANAGSLYQIDGKYSVSDNTLRLTVSDDTSLDYLRELLIKFNLNRLVFGTGQPLVTGGMIKKVNIFIPEFTEQTKIASFLSAVDEKISQLNQKHELLSQYKQGMMQKLFSQQIRFKADDGREFGEWEEVALSEIAVIIMGSSPKSENYNEILNGLPLLQGNADIKNRKSLPRLYTSEITRKCNVGDILLSVRAPVGFVATSEHYACIGRGLCSIKANPNYLQGFIYQWLLSKENSWGSLSQGSTFESVNSDQIKNLRIQIPCLEEQTKIANFLSSIDQKIEVVVQQIEQAKMWKKGLLQQMFV